MANEPITRAEATVLIDERIHRHDEDVDAPKHRENQLVLNALSTKVDVLVLEMTKMSATFAITMKFAGAGVIVWSISQFVNMIQSFRH